MVREDGGPVLPAAKYTVALEGPERLIMGEDGWVSPHPATVQDLEAYRAAIREATAFYDQRPPGIFARLRRFLRRS